MTQIVGMAAISHDHAVIGSVTCNHILLHVLSLYSKKQSPEKPSLGSNSVSTRVFVCVHRWPTSNIWYQSQVLAVAMASQPRSKQPLIGDGSGEKKVQPSRSPPRRRGHSHSRHSRNRNSGSRVIERIVERPSANVAWPMLTRTNYLEWVLVMEVNFQTLRV
jgi:hypothetical protein